MVNKRYLNLQGRLSLPLSGPTPMKKN